MSWIMHYPIGDYLTVLGILLFILYASWHFMKNRLTAKRRTLWIFYAGVLFLFAGMVYGFLERNWWVFFGSMILHAFWMAWIRKRMEDNDDNGQSD